MNKIDALKNISNIFKSLLFFVLLCNSIDAYAQLKDSTAQYYLRLYRGLLVEEVLCIYGDDIKSVRVYLYDFVEYMFKVEIILKKRNLAELRRRKIILVIKFDDYFDLDIEYVYNLKNADIIKLFKGRVLRSQFLGLKINEIETPYGK